LIYNEIEKVTTEPETKEEAKEADNAAPANIITPPTLYKTEHPVQIVKEY
jgi:hypothetical protein